MAFRFRKTIDGDGFPSAMDFPIDAAYTNPAEGDVVTLTGTGTVKRAATDDTSVLGVVVGFNFIDINKDPTIAKVVVDMEAVYEADYTGAGALSIGTEYGIDDNSTLDTGDTTNKIAKIVEVVNGMPYVVITHRQLL